MSDTPEEAVVRRESLAAGNPRLAALVTGVLVALGATAAIAAFVTVQSGLADDDPNFFAGGVVFTAAVSAAIIVGVFYPVWFVEPRAVRAVRGLDPDAQVWPGFRTATLTALASSHHPTPLGRRVYFAVDHRALTVWAREGRQIVAVLELPRTSIRSATVELVGGRLDSGLGVNVAFGDSETPAVVHLLPRRVVENSDREARTLAAAFAPTP